MCDNENSKTNTSNGLLFLCAGFTKFQKAVDILGRVCYHEATTKQRRTAWKTYGAKIKGDERHVKNKFKAAQTEHWCQGLPSILDTCYYYNRSAIKDLGDLLEETEEERARYTEAQAEERLTLYIWRELRAVEKN